MKNLYSKYISQIPQELREIAKEAYTQGKKRYNREVREWKRLSHGEPYPLIPFEEWKPKWIERDIQSKDLQRIIRAFFVLGREEAYENHRRKRKFHGRKKDQRALTLDQIFSDSKAPLLLNEGLQQVFGIG